MTKKKGFSVNKARNLQRRSEKDRKSGRGEHSKKTAARRKIGSHCKGGCSRQGRGGGRRDGVVFVTCFQSGNTKKEEPKEPLPPKRDQ